MGGALCFRVNQQYSRHHQYFHFSPWGWLRAEKYTFFVLETFKSIKPKSCSRNQTQLLAEPQAGFFFLPSERWYVDPLGSVCWEKVTKHSVISRRFKSGPKYAIPCFCEEGMGTSACRHEGDLEASTQPTQAHKRAFILWPIKNNYALLLKSAWVQLKPECLHGSRQAFWLSREQRINWVCCSVL